MLTERAALWLAFMQDGAFRRLAHGVTLDWQEVALLDVTDALFARELEDIEAGVADLPLLRGYDCYTALRPARRAPERRVRSLLESFD